MGFIITGYVKVRSPIPHENEDGTLTYEEVTLHGSHFSHEDGDGTYREDGDTCHAGVWVASEGNVTVQISVHACLRGGCHRFDVHAREGEIIDENLDYQFEPDETDD